MVTDLTGAHLWDTSSIAELDAVVLRYAARNKSARAMGLAGCGTDLHRDLSGHLGARPTTQLTDNLGSAGLHLTADETSALDLASDPQLADYPYGVAGRDQRNRTITGGR